MLKVSRLVFLDHVRRRQRLQLSCLLQRKHQEMPIRLLSNDTGDVSSNLTKHEAVVFLQNVLGISDPISIIKKDKLGFLQEMMRQTKMKIPFTNIHMLSSKQAGEKTPLFEEFKETIFNQEGGHCFASNTFTSAVLQSLGIDTYPIGASVHRWKLPLLNSHMALIAKHLTTPDALHLIDVGSQYFLPPISLDFDRMSQVYHIGSLQYRFFQVSPGVVQLTRRCELPHSGQGDCLIYVENDDCWEVLTTFRTLKPIKFAEFRFTTDFFLENPQVVPEGFIGFWLICYPNNFFISITSERCMTVTETGHTEVTQMKNSEHVIDTILKYFPQYSRKHLERMADFFERKKSQIVQQNHH